jgi:hypothetical protein
VIDFPSKPVGDPAAIRALAREVGRKAQELGSIGSSASVGVTDMTFEGPAAVRIRRDASAWRAQARSSVHELEAVAESLYNAADRLELDLERYRRDFARAEREQDEQRREAQRRHL